MKRARHQAKPAAPVFIFGLLTRISSITPRESRDRQHWGHDVH